MEQQKGPKRRTLGLQLQKPKEGDDDDIIQDNLDEKDQVQTTEKKFGDQVESDLIQQMEKISLQNSSKTQEIVGTDKKLRQIMRSTENKYELKDFQIVDRLGKGNSGGKVDKVVHIPSKQIFALKKISLINDEKFQKYLIAEVKALIACENASIVKYNGAFFEEGYVNILLEYMDYGSLGHILQKVKPIPDVILGIIIIQILEGLRYLHKDMKLIHRDIKPLNILINKEGQVKITDFGVCGSTNSVDMLNSWVGTTLYMSPERLKQDLYSFDTDIWSLGMTILECVLGQHPLSGQDKSFWSLMEQVQQFKIPELPQETSPLIKDFIIQCLQLDRDKRATIDDLWKHDLARKFRKLENGGRDKFVKWLSCLNQK